jgi:phosphoribosyl 1,2-cyclic phosphodiesterase
MSLRLTVLASGSGGNATLVEVNGFGVLIDAGLGPRQLASRLAAAGRSWNDVHALLLTHTHSDHWRDRTLAHLHKRGIPLYCHADHHHTLRFYSPSFPALLAAGLVRPFEAGEDVTLAPALRCRPLPVRHDSGATFGFRLEGAPDLFGGAVAAGYVADLGTWDQGLAAELADVDLLAVEFNHDVALQHASGRPALLIARVLGDNGHLSNAQGADLVRAVLQRSEPGRLRYLVQLHLSRDCNRPLLAREAARAALEQHAADTAVHTASQDEPLPTLAFGHAGGRPRRRAGARRSALSTQPWLPGLDCDESVRA